MECLDQIPSLQGSGNNTVEYEAKHNCCTSLLLLEACLSTETQKGVGPGRRGKLGQGEGEETVTGYILRKKKIQLKEKREGWDP